MDNNSSYGNSPISDELINAFIDHQITKEERLEILSLIKHDKGLAARICELKQLKEMTQQAFASIPDPYPKAATQASFLPRIAAAFAIFSVGLLLGLASIQFSTDPAITVANNDPQGQGDSATTRVLMHLTSADVESGLDTLDNLQQMLDEYREHQQHVLVEVVANGDGIKLLSANNRDIARRLTELTQNYSNLTFAACKNTIEQMQLVRGIRIELIPEVKLIESGMVQVIQRQRDGWTYIRG